MVRLTLIACVAFAVCTRADAVEIRLSELTQGETLERAAPLRDEVFDRESHGRVFSRVELHGVTSHVNYVPVGSTFTWRYYQDRVDGGGRPNGLLGEYAVTYQGPVGSCPWHWSDGSCGLLLKVWSSISRCIPEGRFRVEVLLDGAVLGERVFYPSRFRPLIEAVTIDGQPATPGLPARQGHAAVKASPLTSRVRVAGIVGPEGACKTGDMNWMPGTVVRAAATIEPGSGGHRHFVDGSEIGTGKYLAENPGDVLNPLTPSTRDTVIEGPVDPDSGVYRATYLPGEYGVSENISFQARRAASEKFAALTSPTRSYPVDIRVAGLVEIPQGAADANRFLLKPGSDCGHHPAARYVSGEMLSALGELDRVYRREFAHRLAFGAASLPFGGAIDDGVGDRDARCRSGHDRGLDIDLQRVDEAGDDIRSTAYRRNGVETTRIRFIANFAAGIGLFRVDEGSALHFRLPQPGASR